MILSEWLGRVLSRVLRDRSFPQKCPASPQNHPDATRSVHTNISQNRVSKCTRLHLSAYLLQNISGSPKKACGLRPLGHNPNPPTPPPPPPPPPQTTINPTVDRTLLGGIRQLVNTPGWGDRDCIHVSKGIVHACVNSSQRSLNVSLVEHILRILRARLNGKVRLVCKGWHVRLRVQCKAQFQRSIPSLSDTLT